MTAKVLQTVPTVPQVESRSGPAVTLGICALDEQQSTLALIESALHTVTPSEARIVVVTPSKGLALRLKEASTRVSVVLERVREGKAAAMNKLLDEVESGVVVYASADTWVGEEVIPSLVKTLLSDPKNGAVVAHVVPVNRRGTMGKVGTLLWEIFNSTTNALNAKAKLAQGNDLYAFRRELVRMIPPGTINDDTYIASTVRRQGFLVRTANVSVHVSGPTNPLDYLVQRGRITLGHLQTIKNEGVIPSVLQFTMDLSVLAKARLVSRVVAQLGAKFLLPALVMVTLEGLSWCYAMSLGLLRKDVRKWKVAYGTKNILPGIVRLPDKSRGGFGDVAVIEDLGRGPTNSPQEGWASPSLGKARRDLRRKAGAFLHVRPTTIGDMVRMYFALVAAGLLRLIGIGRLLPDLKIPDDLIPGEKELTVRVGGMLALARPRSYDLTIIAGAHEPTTARWFKFKPGDVFVDVGAHIGLYSLAAAREGCEVVAVEPEESNYGMLSRNIHLNNLKGIALEKVALSSTSERRLLYPPSGTNLGSFSLLSNWAKVRPSGPQRPVEVECITLDALAEKHGIDIVDWLKIDAEGHELEVLRGACHVLTRTKHLIIEVSRGNEETCRQILERADFVLTDIEHDVEASNWYLTTRKAGSKVTSSSAA